MFNTRKIKAVILTAMFSIRASFFDWVIIKFLKMEKQSKFLSRLSSVKEANFSIDGHSIVCTVGAILLCVQSGLLYQSPFQR